MTNVRKVVKEGAAEISGTILYCLRKALKCAPNAILFINPYMSVSIAYEAYTANNNVFCYWVLWIPLGLFLLAQLLRLIGRVAFEEVNGCPVARKRFVRRGERGELIFNTRDVYEMAEYLAEVEDYCERHGKYRRKP